MSGMSKEQLYDKVLSDWIHADIYDPINMIKDLIMLLDTDAVDKFAQDHGYILDE